MRVFVDTNVLVYARDVVEPEKQALAMRWLDRLWEDRAGRLSAQVLSEYYVTVTRKLRPGMPVDAARRDVRALRAWNPVPVSALLVERAWTLQDRFSVSYWDALIVAAAQVADCDLLLSEDMQDGQAMDGLKIVNPFRQGPEILEAG